MRTVASVRQKEVWPKSLAARDSVGGWQDQGTLLRTWAQKGGVHGAVGRQDGAVQSGCASQACPGRTGRTEGRPHSCRTYTRLDTHTQTQTHKHTHRERETDRQTDRHTNIHTHTQMVEARSGPSNTGRRSKGKCQSDEAEAPQPYIVGEVRAAFFPS